MEKLSPEIKQLIDEGKKKGYLTYDEMNRVLPDDVVSPEKLDSLLQMLDDLGIEMVDDTQGAGKEAFEEEEFDREDAEELEDLKSRTGSSEKIDDPVRMYLTQMGEIPLLSREDELRLAKKIEITRKRFRTKVLECPVAAVQAQAVAVVGQAGVVDGLLCAGNGSRRDDTSHCHHGAEKLRSHSHSSGKNSSPHRDR